MGDELRMTSNDYSISLLVFFISYVLFETPSNMILTRVRPSIYMPVSLYSPVSILEPPDHLLTNIDAYVPLGWPINVHGGRS